MSYAWPYEHVQLICDGGKDPSMTSVLKLWRVRVREIGSDREKGEGFLDWVAKLFSVSL